MSLLLFQDVPPPPPTDYLGGFYLVLWAAILVAAFLSTFIVLVNIGINRFKAYEKRAEIKDEFQEKKLRADLFEQHQDYLNAVENRKSRALVGEVANDEELEKWKVAP